MAEGLDVHFKSICRKSCSSSAELIADILERYRTKFELAQAFGTAVQHAGTAATALMGEIVMQGDPVERSRLVEKLSSLRISVSLMARNYRGAGLMVNVINQFIRTVTRNQSGREKLSEDCHPVDSDAMVGAIPMAGELDQLVVAQGPAMMANPITQRWRLDSWSTFAPSPSSHLSPAGLPFLPSSFLEGINEDEFYFGDNSGAFDNSAWGNGPAHGFQ